LRPEIFGLDKELSYTIYPPKIQRSGTIVAPTNPLTQGFGGGSWYENQIRIWNSGNNTLQNLPVRFYFESKSKDIRITNSHYSTKPEHEFGVIEKEQIDDKSERYTYHFLKKGNEIRLTFNTNEVAEAKVECNVDGVSVNPVEPAGRFGKNLVDFLFMTLIAFMLALVWRLFVLRKAKAWNTQEPRETGE